MTTLSLDLAKELQEVCKAKGITMPESEFGWCGCDSVGEWSVSSCYYAEEDYFAPAYTLDELLEWLPKRIKVEYRLHLTTTSFNQFMVYYEKHTNSIESNDNPCDACGKLLLWLVKEGLIK